MPETERQDYVALESTKNEVEARDFLTNQEVQLHVDEPPSSPPEFAIRNLYVSSVSYIVFTMTDGAARTIVLLHAHDLGFNAIEIALMFSLYELMGVATNLLGGFFGSQNGLRSTFLVALTLQLIGFTALAFTSTVFGDLKVAEGHRRFQAFWWIALCQAMNGVAKDLAKLAGKACPKLVTTDQEEGRLFKLVAWITGMKNSMKGVGFFIGGVLLEAIGYVGALGVMAGFIGALIPLCWFYLDPLLGISKQRATCAQIFKKERNVNILSGARFFLFGARDIWFEIAAPLFLSANPFDWSSFAVGGFMAGYTIIYGQFQAFTSSAFKKKKVPRSPEVRDVISLAGTLAVLPGTLGGILYGVRSQEVTTQVVFMIGMSLFAILFAFNSAVHSYMIVLFSNRDKVAMDLGFYYMANAGGRLLGTIMSGFIFHYTREDFGLSVCLWISSAFLIGATAVSTLLKKT